jgi:hypothetical protein
MKNAVMRLPFVTETKEGFDLWCVKATEDWGADCAMGGHYADLFLDLGEPILLGHVVKAMKDKPDWGGVEVGFFHRVAEHAVNQKSFGLEKVESKRASRLLDEMPTIFTDLAALHEAV